MEAPNEGEYSFVTAVPGGRVNQSSVSYASTTNGGSSGNRNPYMRREASTVDYNPHSGLPSTATISPRLPSWDEPALDSGSKQPNFSMDRWGSPTLTALAAEPLPVRFGNSLPFPAPPNPPLHQRPMKASSTTAASPETAATNDDASVVDKNPKNNAGGPYYSGDEVFWTHHQAQLRRQGQPSHSPKNHHACSNAEELSKEQRTTSEVHTATNATPAVPREQLNQSQQLRQYEEQQQYQQEQQSGSRSSPESQGPERGALVRSPPPAPPLLSQPPNLATSTAPLLPNFSRTGHGGAFSSSSSSSSHRQSPHRSNDDFSAATAAAAEARLLAAEHELAKAEMRAQATVASAAAPTRSASPVAVAPAPHWMAEMHPITTNSNSSGDEATRTAVWSEAVDVASHAAAQRVVDSVIPACSRATSQLETATQQLAALAQNATFSVDENSWGGHFGARVASSGTPLPPASAWLRDLGRGLIHLGKGAPTSGPATGAVVAGAAAAAVRSSNNTTRQPSNDGLDAVAALARLIADGMGSDGNQGLLRSSSGAYKSPWRGHSVALNHPSRNNMSSKSSTNHNNENSTEVLSLAAAAGGAVGGPSAHEAEEAVTSLLGGLGAMAVACGDVVDRLQERDRLRRAQLQDTVARVEQVAGRTARQLVTSEREANAAKQVAWQAQSAAKAAEGDAATARQLGQAQAQAQAATRDANRLAEALQQQADDAARQLRALEQKHAQALNQCRSEAQANATTLQQQHDASLKALEAKHVAELDACKAKLQKEQREAITELSRQGDTWCSKAAAAEARAEEALSGRAAAEARARDALDREVKRLREVQAESLRQVNARADAKEQALQAARAYDQQAAAQREQFLREEAETVAAKHKAALAAAQQSCHLDSEALVKTTERRVASEYEAHIRTLKATHEAETRRAGQEVMQLRRELQRFKSGGGGGGHLGGPSSFAHHSALACGDGGDGNHSTSGVGSRGGGGEQSWSDGNGGASPELMLGDNNGAVHWLSGLDLSGQADLNASLPVSGSVNNTPRPASAHGLPVRTGSREAPPVVATPAGAAAERQAPPRDRRSPLSVGWGNAASVTTRISALGQQQQDEDEPRALPPRQSVGLTPPRIGRARTVKGGQVGAVQTESGSQMPQDSKGSNGKGTCVQREHSGKAAALAGAHAAALEAYLKTHA